jgi:hypothetical protein
MFHDLPDHISILNKAYDLHLITAEIRLWYVPFGEFDENEVLFFSEDRKLELKGEWVWRN